MSETFKTNQKRNCNGKYLFYLLKYRKCLKQYVGQTVEEFRYRWNNCKNNGCYYQDLSTCMQRHLFEHFSEDVYLSFLGDISIILIEKLTRQIITERKLLQKHSCHGDWTMNSELEIVFCFIHATGFVQLVIRTLWKMILVPLTIRSMLSSTFLHALHRECPWLLSIFALTRFVLILRL